MKLGATSTGLTYEIATRRDIPDIRELWQTCFHDPDEWIDWYLGSPFDDTLWLLCRDAGKLISMIHLRDYATRIRGVILPSVAYCGFATHPDYRGRGLITDLIIRVSAYARERDAIIGFHSPNKIDRHHCVLHFTCADISTFENDAPTITLPAYTDDKFPQLFACYNEFARKYSCIVSRTDERMRLRIADFLADGGDICYTERDGKLTGYAMHHGGSAEEVVFTGDAARQKLMSALCGGVLPPEYGARTPFSVMNTIDMPALMQRFAPPRPVRINDNILPWNAGVYGSGEPAIETDSGHWTQLVNGYRSVYELIDEGSITVLDNDSAGLFDAAFPKQACYVFEKY